MSNVLPSRADVALENTWDLDVMFASVEAWEAAFEKTVARIPELTAFQGRLNEGPKVLARWFRVSEEIGREAGHIAIYASLGYSVDTGDSEASARSDRGRGLMGRVGAAAAFAQPELLAIGAETLAQWLSETPALQIYQHRLERLEKQSAHVRSAEVEQLLGQLGDVFRTAASTHAILTNTDLDFKPATTGDPEPVSKEVAQSTIGGLLVHEDRNVRKTAYRSYADAHLANKNTMANCLAAGVKQDVFRARARGYGSSLEAALGPSFLPTDVFHNTIDAYIANLSTWHRYWAVRRKALGYDELHPHDFKAPLSRNMPEVSFKQSMDWIAAGMAPLGGEYVEAMMNGVFNERWVDIYPNKGKRLGAFSSGMSGTNPYIFMSYSDDLFGMSTLAHELGHSMHSYFSRKHQPQVYARYSLFEAEVASNLNQALTRAHLLATHDDVEFQIAVIEEAMANFYRYFFVMPTLARFELEIHERVERGEALTADALINLMADLFGEGFGDAVVMDRDRVGITWAQFSSHLYANFYVFQYTTGISGAHALAKDILSGADGAVDSYLAFLRSGGSRYPVENLRLAGVDMLSPSPVEETFAVLSSYVDRLEALVDAR